MKIALNCLPNRLLVFDISLHHLFSLECRGICWESVMQMKTHFSVCVFFFFFNSDAFIRLLSPRCMICHLKQNLYECLAWSFRVWGCAGVLTQIQVLSPTGWKPLLS